MLCVRLVCARPMCQLNYYWWLIFLSLIGLIIGIGMCKMLDEIEHARAVSRLMRGRVMDEWMMWTTHTECRICGWAVCVCMCGLSDKVELIWLNILFAQLPSFSLFKSMSSFLIANLIIRDEFHHFNVSLFSSSAAHECVSTYLSSLLLIPYAKNAKRRNTKFPKALSESEIPFIPFNNKWIWLESWTQISRSTEQSIRHSLHSSIHRCQKWQAIIRSIANRQKQQLKYPLDKNQIVWDAFVPLSISISLLPEMILNEMPWPPSQTYPPL